ncbi:hypothetical protein ACN8ZM_40435 (plasmid) [Burkholderia aenigmatica]|uniref:hypothetical protein n=1 Tax=Burkholderia aenigmatica TaxID=2015348 RepID=UPI003B436CDB
MANHDAKYHGEDRGSSGKIVRRLTAAVIAFGLSACAAVDPSLQQNAGAYRDVIDYQMAIIKNSLHRQLTFASSQAQQPGAPANTDNMILSGASRDALAQVGALRKGNGFSALHLAASTAQVGSGNLYKQFCASRGGTLNVRSFAIDGRAGTQSACVAQEKLVFVVRSEYLGKTQCFGGNCASATKYDSVSLEPPVAVPALPKDARAELVALGAVLTQ